jgi:hypothetical protein
LTNRITKYVQRVKEFFSFAFMLKFPNFTKPFEMHTNANGFTIWGVLMQNKYVITFERKKLMRPQLRWLTHENNYS